MKTTATSTKPLKTAREWEQNSEGWKWKPSIFMPKGAARLWLEITDIRVRAPAGYF
jgi:hypothetical protein